MHRPDDCKKCGTQLELPTWPLNTMDGIASLFCSVQCRQCDARYDITYCLTNIEEIDY